MERHVRSRDILLAALAGFFVSFTIFFFGTLFPSDVLFRAQLLLGDPGELRREFPGLVEIAGQREQVHSATHALVSVWWWIAVVMTGFFFTLFFVRVLRR